MSQTHNGYNGNGRHNGDRLKKDVLDAITAFLRTGNVPGRSEAALRKAAAERQDVHLLNHVRNETPDNRRGEVRSLLQRHNWRVPEMFVR